MFEHESSFLIPPYSGTTATSDGSIQVQQEADYKKVVGMLKSVDDGQPTDGTVAKIIFAWFELNQDVLPLPTILVQIEYILSEFWATLLGRKNLSLTAASLPGKPNSLEIVIDDTLFKNQNESAREFFLKSVSREMNEAYTYLYVHALVDGIRKEFAKYSDSSSVVFNDRVVHFQTGRLGFKVLHLEVEFLDGANYDLNYQANGINDYFIYFSTIMFDEEKDIGYAIHLELSGDKHSFRFVINPGNQTPHYISFETYAEFASAIKGRKYNSEIIFHQLSQMARDLLSVVMQLKKN